MKRISHKDLRVGQEYVAIRTNLPNHVKIFSTDYEPIVRIRLQVTGNEGDSGVYKIQVLESDILSTCQSADKFLKSLHHKSDVRVKLGLPLYTIYEITRGVRRGKINMIKRKRV